MPLLFLSLMMNLTETETKSGLTSHLKHNVLQTGLSMQSAALTLMNEESN